MRTLLIISIFFISSLVSAENLTLTTYYPAPSGAYKNMRSHGLCVGTTCTNATISDNNLVVQGHIGIGTTVPGYALQIGNAGAPAGMPASTGTDALISGNLGIVGTIYGNGSGLTGVVAAPAGADKEVQYNNNTVTAGAVDFVFDQNTGHVGIGSANPQARLAVQGGGVTSATSALIVQDSSQKVNLTVLDNGFVGIGTTRPNDILEIVGLGSAVRLTDGPVATRVFSSQVHSKGYMGTWTNHAFVLRTNDEDRVTIAPVTGNVGLGTIMPSTRLDVNGTVRIRGGAPQANLVLTATDNLGNAIWKTGGGGADALIVRVAKACNTKQCNQNCPAGYTAISGGWQGNGFENIDCNQAYDLPGISGWKVCNTAETAFPWNLSVTCMKN